MDPCAFCRIIDKEEMCYLLFESEKIISFLDIDPINEGHVLILPKIHCSSIEELPLSVLSEMMALSQKVVAALTQIYRADGYSLMQNGGEFCDFGHFHMHIFPRYKKDGFGWTYPEGPSECSLNIAKRIIEYL